MLIMEKINDFIDLQQVKKKYGDRLFLGSTKLVSRILQKWRLPEQGYPS